MYVRRFAFVFGPALYMKPNYMKYEMQKKSVRCCYSYVFYFSAFLIVLKQQHCVKKIVLKKLCFVQLARE